MLTNEQVRQIREKTHAEILARNAALLRQQEEMHNALRETYGPEGVDIYNTFENAKAILARDDAPDALLWDSARELAKSYTQWKGTPTKVLLETSKWDLCAWNINGQPFSNGREALLRIINIFDNPSLLTQEAYNTIIKELTTPPPPRFEDTTHGRIIIGSGIVIAAISFSLLLYYVHKKVCKKIKLLPKLKQLLAPLPPNNDQRS